MIEKKNKVSYLVSAEVFRGELWSECVSYSSMSGPITGVIEMLFARFARENPDKAHELLKSLMDIQYNQ